MPQCLLDFCGHKASYDVVMERWNQHHFAEHLSAVRPGDDFYDYLQQSFTGLPTQARTSTRT
jgi:hypothetical protein